MQKVLVSACLIGQPVRYDGNGFDVTDVLSGWLEEGRLVTICPEVAGGLSIPREPAEIQQGTGAGVIAGNKRVLTLSGRDVTGEFLQGAQLALNLALAEGVQMAVLKARSPSCGNEKIYNGSFQRFQIDGAGVTAALLKEHGIQVFNEDQLDAASLYLHALES